MLRTGWPCTSRPRSTCAREIDVPTLAIAAAAVLACAIAACRTTDENSFSDRFRSSYATAGDNLVWISRKSDHHFTRILVDPLRFRVWTPGRFGQADPGVELKLSLAFERVMTEGLSRTYPFVTRPTEGALRIAAAITDRISVPELLERASWMNVGDDGDMGALGLEVRLFDATSGALVAAAVSRRYAPVYQANLRDPDPVALERTFVPLALGIKRALDESQLR